MQAKNTSHKIPDNIAELQSLVLTLLADITNKDIEIKTKDTEIELLRHKLHAQLAARFASKSEKHKHQADLFDEAMPPEQTELTVIETADEEITIAAHTRKKVGRKPLPKDLPREQIIHDLSEAEKTCSCGCQMHKIGEDKSEQLEWIPAQVKVIEHVRIKYACRDCEELIKSAPMPKLPIPKSIATPGLLAEILISKYEDHLPLYRQEKILQRMGVDIARATLSNWMIKCGELLQPLTPLLRNHLISSSYIQADETTLQVLNEPGRSNTTKSYMWVFKGGPPDKPGVIFEYHETRAGTAADIFLQNFVGALQSDAYSGYMQFKPSTLIALYLCWAHARRKFSDIVKANKNKPGKAHMAVNFIAKLYAVEKQARENNLNFEQRKELRKEAALPVLNKFKVWLDDSSAAVPLKSPIGEAIGYTLRHWTELTKYINNGEVEIDNNIVENLIRPFALGRKNWLFFGSPEGAEAGAVIYSLIQTCKLNQIEPYAYFKYVLANIRSWDKSDLKALLPQFIDPLLLKQAYTNSFLN
ncbi:MAG: IS66 family transposase [Rickettsiaceae bacterium]|nr:IS66 family transposase [Rickettsiaceae bacterium]